MTLWSRAFCVHGSDCATPHSSHLLRANNHSGNFTTVSLSLLPDKDPDWRVGKDISPRRQDTVVLLKSFSPVEVPFSPIDQFFDR